MSDPNKDTNKKNTGTRTAESKVRGTAEKATAPAARAEQVAATRTGDAASAAKAGAQRS
ncbi:hypothetical protein SMCF_5895, partial [Streptomyces coelicoflavus ZG0656]